MNNVASARRLDGLDLARFLAFVGMVIVNFKIAMGADKTNGGVLGQFTEALEGRAAATFVVLSGIGLGLAAVRSEQGSNRNCDAQTSRVPSGHWLVEFAHF